MTPGKGRTAGQSGMREGTGPSYSHADKCGRAAEGENAMTEAGTAKRPRDARKKKLVVEALEGGLTLDEAAKAAKTTRQTIWRWRKADPEYAAVVGEAMDQGAELAEDALLQCATRKVLENPAYQTSMIFLLKNRRPHRWRDVQDRRYEGNIRHEVSLTDEQRQAELEAYMSEVQGDDDTPEEPQSDTVQPDQAQRDPWSEEDDKEPQ